MVDIKKTHFLRSGTVTGSAHRVMLTTSPVGSTASNAGLQRTAVIENLFQTGNSDLVTGAAVPVELITLLVGMPASSAGSSDPMPHTEIEITTEEATEAAAATTETAATEEEMAATGEGTAATVADHITAVVVATAAAAVMAVVVDVEVGGE